MQENRKYLTILNIGLDQDLANDGEYNESQLRQIMYSEWLPSKIIHIVKTRGNHPEKITTLNQYVSIYTSPVIHWLLYLVKATLIGRRIIKTQKVDIIQTQESYFSGLIGKYLSVRYRIPLIVGAYSDEIENPLWVRQSILNKIANKIGKKILRGAAVIRTDSLAVYERLRPCGCKNIMYIPFAITNADVFMDQDERASELRASLLMGQRGPLVLTVSRLEPEKNIEMIFQALAGLKVKFPGMVLAVVGDGRLEEDLRKKGEQYLPRRVRWVGRINNKDLAAYYQASEVTLLASERESAARVLYESLLSGTTVITTATAGANEVIKDRLTGRIVEVGNREQFAVAIDELLSNPQLARKMGKTGKEDMRKLVSLEKVVSQLRTMYELAIRK